MTVLDAPFYMTELDAAEGLDCGLDASDYLDRVGSMSYLDRVGYSPTVSFDPLFEQLLGRYRLTAPSLLLTKFPSSSFFSLFE